MRARTYARMDAGKVTRKTEKNSCKAWNCAQSPANGTEFLHGQGGTFYVSATKNIRFRNGKPTVRTAKTYGPHGGNIRFAKGKHKNYGNITRFSTRGFLKKLAPNEKLIRFFRQEQENTPSRKGIKKGVPLNSNLC